MTTYDTIEFGGEEKSFVDWGISASSVHGQKQNQEEDTFTITLGMVSLVDESVNPTFPFEASIIVRVSRKLSNGIFSDGAIKFQGKRVGRPEKGDNQGQGVTYKFSGPWYDLKHTQYQQAFKGAGGVDWLVAETVLFSYAQGFKFGGAEFYYGNISAGDQIHLILQWLLDQYAAQGMDAPFQFVGHDLGSAVTVAANSSGGFFSWPITGTPTISLELFSVFMPTFITKPIFCANSKSI